MRDLRPLLRRFAVPMACLALLAWDCSRPAASQLSSRVLVGGIRVYQATLSRLMPGMGVTCHFTPTCSHYAVAVLQRHGTLGGTWRAAKRIARCGPWTPMGVVDPPN